MRRWRVGSFSMGVTLIMLGISLLISMMNGVGGADFLLGWWPIVFVLLGGEVLIHLFISKEKHPVIGYDIFSILFVGLICTIGLGLAVLTSSGVMTEIREAVGGTERSTDLPELRETLTTDVKKVVVSSDNHRLQITRDTGNEIYLFGTYRETLLDGKPQVEIRKEDVASFRKTDSTVYVEVKELPANRGLSGNYTSSNLMLLIPQDAVLEVHGSYQLLDE